jgi:hypothetical protein
MPPLGDAASLNGLLGQQITLDDSDGPVNIRQHSGCEQPTHTRAADNGRLPTVAHHGAS